MNNELYSHFIGYRTNFFQEENQVIAEFVRINILVTVQFILELLQCKTFLRTGQSCNHISCQTMNFFLIHLCQTRFCLFYLFGRVFLFGSRTFQDKHTP